MKLELEQSYRRIIDEFRREERRLQSRCDQLSQELFDAQKTIEQLKNNLNSIKTQRYVDRPILRENNSNVENLQSRYDNLLKLFNKTNETFVFISARRNFILAKENNLPRSTNEQRRPTFSFEKLRRGSMNKSTDFQSAMTSIREKKSFGFGKVSRRKLFVKSSSIFSVEKRFFEPSSRSGENAKTNFETTKRLFRISLKFSVFRLFSACNKNV